MAQTKEEVRARKRAWKQANPDKVKEHARRSYLRNKEKILARDKAYKKKNPERTQAARDKWAENNWEKMLASKRAYKRKNWDKVRAANAAYREANKERLLVQNREYMRALSPERKLEAHARNYGLTAFQLMDMRAERDGVCDLCKEKQQRPLVIDHCHETGVVRGLLCQACNAGMGLLQDDPELMQAAAQYVLKHRKSSEVA